MKSLVKNVMSAWEREGFSYIVKNAPKYINRRYVSNLNRLILRQRFDDSGMQILDRDWDTLFIFDCARYDLFAECIDLHGSLSKERSVASVTANFVERNFEGRQAQDVVYLSANPVVGNRKEFLDVFKFVGVWHETKQDRRAQENHRGLMDSEPVIEKARELHEQYPGKRHIVHFLPPHVPHMFKNGEELEEDSPYRNYEAARNDVVSADEMRKVYAESLQFVIERATELLAEIDGKVVLTADHGELLGEEIPLWMKILHNRWGNQWRKYDFGHYSNIDVPELVEVPWFELPAESRREIEPEAPVTDEYDTQSIEDKLEALGYRT